MNITIELAGKEYQLSEPPHKAARAWRAEYGKKLIEPLLGAINAVDWVKWSGESQDVGELLKRLAPHLTGTAAGLIDLLDVGIDALFAFSAEIKADAERLDAEVRSSELLKAMFVVARVVYPLDSLPVVGPMIGSLLDRDTTKKN